LLAASDTVTKHKALQAIARKLQENTNNIVEANTKDIERSTQQNLAAPLLKRLKFDEQKLMKQ
jgi:glutamate-5-semialdehyde dehydrogenase